MSYIGIPPFGQTIRSVTNITATASQTDFNIVGGYQAGYVDVFLNGVLLVPTTDYTATDGLTVVLGTGATAGDAFQALSYQPVSLVDVYTQSQVDTLLATKQNTLVSGTNIKTVNSTTLLGSGDLAVATTAQGALADSSVQPGDNVSDLTNDAGYLTSSTGVTTVNGSSGAVSVATTAQGSLADSALQPGDNISELTNNSGYLTSLSTTNWTITESGGVLYFAYSGTNKAKLDSSGNLTVVGNVTAYGTV